MIRITTVAASFGLALITSTSGAFADVERACRQSDRPASQSLCRCIGRVADSTLSRTDQRVVAKWFKDPDQAQSVRQSDRRSDERLWQKYQAFGSVAVRRCG